MRARLLAILAVAALLSACAALKKEAPPEHGFYGGDGLPENMPVDPFSVPDAVPKAEPLSKTGNQRYEALGETYYPMRSAVDFVERGAASWYGSKFQGKRTSSGEPYDMFAMTAAHPTLPLPSYVRVTNLDNGRQVVVKVNDRGPFLHDRVIDLSYAAAVRLGYAGKGTGNVEIRTLFADDEPAAASTAGPGFETPGGEPIGVYVQVGAFSDAGNARALRSHLLAEGFAPVEVAPSEPGRPLYRVRVGPFASDAEAGRKKASLRDVLNTPVHIVYD
ncbi:MAG: septal ring lytic transglycosylase RlpA family protein [Pseudomonadota bacterium]|nr:septal ring lytic transglycosylase RlpA family protein [Pseudomonadota bacterium]